MIPRHFMAEILQIRCKTISNQSTKDTLATHLEVKGLNHTGHNCTQHAKYGMPMSKRKDDLAPKYN